jgi:hypothetical protein
VAPVGLAGGNPFTIGGQAAALTYGHSSGYLAAAAFALMISHLADGGTRPDGLEGRDVITQVADDLYDVFAEGRKPSPQRYPG